MPKKKSHKKSKSRRVNAHVNNNTNKINIKIGGGSSGSQPVVVHHPPFQLQPQAAPPQITNKPQYLESSTQTQRERENVLNNVVNDTVRNSWLARSEGFQAHEPVSGGLRHETLPKPNYSSIQASLDKLDEDRRMHDEPIKTSIDERSKRLKELDQRIQQLKERPYPKTSLASEFQLAGEESTIRAFQDPSPLATGGGFTRRYDKSSDSESGSSVSSAAMDAHIRNISDTQQRRIKKQKEKQSEYQKSYRERKQASKET